jgi:tetratricopeptide (TPR) repeat protein
LAWMLASASDGSLRDGPRAVALAEAANRSLRGADALTLHALAAAYAENKQFDKAIETADQALRLAQLRNDVALVEQLQREIQLYQTGSSYHEP